MRTSQAKERRVETTTDRSPQSRATEFRQGRLGPRAAPMGSNMAKLTSLATRAPRGGRGAALAAATAAESDSATEHSPPVELHIGLLLRRAREQRGLSASDIANKTRISLRWITAIEEGRVDQLPAPVFVSGYVRNYARTVGMDPADALDRYLTLKKQRENNRGPNQPGVSSSLSDSMERAVLQRRYFLWTALLILVGAGALLGLWLRARGHAG